DTVKAVNEWAYDRTDGMIDEIIEDIDPDAVMLLLNSLLFESEWEEKIEVAYDGFFSNSDGVRQNTVMMNGNAEYYIADINGEGCIKKLNNGCSFFAILPNRDMTADEYAASLTGEGLYNMLNGAQQTDVELYIPAFSTYTENELSKALSSLGMKDAFYSETADFSNIDKNEDGLFIGRVAQNARIDVTMDGVKAGAVTVVELRDEGASINLQIFDRPFVYGIMTDDGIPLFIGVQNQI
ncbi:MAG: serine protease, partial [Clostridia bacterium]|nr:serine protease [Clostridia bacterium]